MTSICLGLIVRNEARTLEKCLTSARPVADYIIVGLAGPSDDETPEIARRLADEVLDVPWKNDFSAARNLVLSRATIHPANFTHFMWLDGDDELVGDADSIRQQVAGAPDVSAFYLPYDYWRDDNGVTVSSLIRERIVDLSIDWRWLGRVHEILHTDTAHKTRLIEGAKVVHHPHKDRVPDRNLTLLYEELNTAELDGRPIPATTLSYLGNEELLRGNLKPAAAHLTRAAALSAFPEEKYQCLHKAADCFRAMGDLIKAQQYNLQAMAILPTWPDAFYGMAEIASDREQWEEVVQWTTLASKIPPPRTVLITNPLDYSFHPALILANAQLHLNQLDEAMTNFRSAYEISPKPALELHIRRLENEQAAQGVLKAFMKIHEYLGRSDEWVKVRHLFRAVPKLLESHPTVTGAHHRALQHTRHLDDPSVLEEFYSNNDGWVPIPEESLWSPEWKEYPRVAYARSVAEMIGAQTILDMGSSDGFVSLPVAEMLPDTKIHGLDIDQRCVDLANQRATEHGLTNVEFFKGDLSIVDEWSACENFYKYDLALLFEVIEHVEHPKKLLEIAERAAAHVAITTPYLSWDDPTTKDDWDAPGIKQHVRIFDLNDIELLLSSRGRIHNLQRVPLDAGKSWIFADYEVGQQETLSKVQIICPPVIEPWDPRKYRLSGLGGSETAVIELSKHLADSGHSVTVYGDPELPGYYDKVCWREIDSYNSMVRSDLSIAWRHPEAGKNRPNTRLHILWTHDTDYGKRFNAESYLGFDYIVVLSEWHRDYFLNKYPFVDPNKLVIIGNGVDLSRFYQSPERNPLKVIYSSSPDRGLDIILEHIWPRVIAEVPNAELHYYYGWQNHENLGDKYPDLMQFKAATLEAAARTRNVFSHGRLPQGELAREMQSGSLWLYPTYFHETYCITAVEAQLSGLVPVYNPIGALNETVQAGVFVTGDPHSPEVIDKYVETVVGLLLHPPSDQLREEIREGAPASTWQEVAQRWEDVFLPRTSTSEPELQRR